MPLDTVAVNRLEPPEHISVFVALTDTEGSSLTVTTVDAEGATQPLTPVYTTV